jgi:tryptophan-rich sensory protein
MSESKRKVLLPSLAGNLAVFLLLPLVLNGLIFGLGWNGPARAMAGIPPGWVVGSLWMLLFAGMAVARWLLLREAVTRNERAVSEWVSALAFLCLIYPLYTVGLSNERIGLIGNSLTAMVAIVVAARAWRVSRAAAGCVSAVVLWLLYAAGATAYAVMHSA